MSDTQDQAIKTILAYKDSLMNSVRVRGKTISEWIEYFDIDIPLIDNDLTLLRRKFSECSTKYGECINMVTEYGLLLNKLKQEEEIGMMDSKAGCIIGEDKKKLSRDKIEAIAKSDNKKIVLSRMMAEMFLSIFKDQMIKIKSSIGILEAINNSIMSEMKNLKYTTGGD